LGTKTRDWFDCEYNEQYCHFFVWLIQIVAITLEIKASSQVVRSSITTSCNNGRNNNELMVNPASRFSSLVILEHHRACNSCKRQLKLGIVYDRLPFVVTL
jgi:hypothetical protein